MVKQPACAAAINSSGFVPFSLSKRVLNEYGVCASTPESVERLPLPARPVPRQTAFALRIMECLLCGGHFRCVTCHAGVAAEAAKVIRQDRGHRRLPAGPGVSDSVRQKKRSPLATASKRTRKGRRRKVACLTLYCG